MGTLVDTEAMKKRQREIADEIARLQSESEELTFALRVVGRFSLPDPEPSFINPFKTLSPESQEAQAPQAPEPADAAGPAWVPRPAGTPTNYEMAEFVLASAEKEGKDGLTGSELVAAIRNRYWPGLVNDQILPSIYAFAKKGRLKKTPSGKFKRIKRNDAQMHETADASTPAVS